MNKRQKASVQRLLAGHDVSVGCKSSKFSSKSRLSVTTASTASSRAKERHLANTRLHNVTQKDLSRSTSFQSNPNKSRLEKHKRKGPAESEAFFTNLLLLGFDPDEMSARNRGSSIPFDKDMFQVPNMLAFQVVMHFLLNKLDTVKFHEEFRDCWPICDRKQEQAFRKGCLSWLTEISERESDAHLPRLVPSLFLSPGGPRFYQLMLSLTTFILKKLIRQDGHRSKMALKIQHPELTTKNNHLSDLLARTMKEVVARRKSNFFSCIQQSIIVHKECEQFADELVKEYRQLNEDVKEKERILEKLKVDNGNAVVLSPRGLDSVSALRRQKMAKVRQDWSQIFQYYQSSRKEREVVTSIIQGTIDKHRIHASDFTVQVPDYLLRHCQEEVLRRKIGNTLEGGKMDLINVLKLWTLSVEVCLKKAGGVSLLKLNQFSPNLLKLVHDASAYLANLRALKNKVNEVDIPEIQKCIAELKNHLDLEVIKTPGKLWQNPKESLGFMPPTPPVNFDESGVEEGVLPRIKGKTPPDVSSTPEAAARIMSAVRKRNQRPTTSVACKTTSKLPKRLLIDQENHNTEEDQLVESRVLRLRQHSPDAIDTGRISTPTRPRIGNNFTGKKSTTAKKSSTKVSVKKQMPALKKPLVVRNVKEIETESENPAKPIIKSKSSALRDGSTSALGNKKSDVKKRTASKQLNYDSPINSRGRAEEKLINQIVDAVTGGTPQNKENISADSTPGYDTSDLNLIDPLPGLDDAVFKTRDKLAHSPLDSAIGSNSNVKKSQRVKFSPSTRIEISPEIIHSERIDNFVEEDNTTDLDYENDMKTPAQEKMTKRYISPLPEFDSPIQLPCEPDVEIPAVQVHEPSPVRLEALSAEQQLVDMSGTLSAPAMDVDLLSPVDDVMDASVELVDLSSDESDEKEDIDDLVPTGNLIGFIPREPTPSCITPFKNQNDSSLVLGKLSPGDGPHNSAGDGATDLELDFKVLNSDERIELIHEVEKSFEEKMLNMSLKATGTPKYAKNVSAHTGSGKSRVRSRSNLNFEDHNKSPFSKNDTLKLYTSPHDSELLLPSSPRSFMEENEETTCATEEAQHSYSTIDKDSFKGSKIKTNSDIISRFHSLKVRSQKTVDTSSRSVLTPDREEKIDEIYLQQSPRQDPEMDESSGVNKFHLDIHFDHLVDDSDNDNNKSDLNNNGAKNDKKFEDSENDELDEGNNLEEMLSFNDTSRTFIENTDLSGILDFNAEDILLPTSPNGILL